MPKFKSVTRRLTVGLVAVFLATAFPLSALADGATPACDATITGTTRPTGAAAGTFTYSQDTCLWENDYFSWSPVTKVYTPKFAQPYTYNSSTGKYDAPNWVYNPAAGAYRQTTISVATPPAGVTVIGGPPAITNTGSGSSNGINSTNAAGGSSISNTGAGSANDINNRSDSGTDVNNSNNLTVNNTLGSTAISGDASVTQNTLGGDATSGSATVSASVINLLQSNTSLQGNVVTFNYDIYGNVQGDLSIDPSQLNNINTNVPAGSSDNLTINTNNDATINNNIDLTAASGDATVARNTAGGSATSGTANAVANIINVINSIISSGQSFIGSVNIYGNFNGDILLPQDTLNKILASNFPTVNASVNPDGSVSLVNNTGPNSDNNIDNSSDSTTTVNNVTDTNIKNDVNLAASSGNAAVKNNTSAGSATSGTATTNLVLLNLTGQQIICGDALLVFVNVLGNWVGMIVNAPAGTTAAALGGGNCTASTLPGSNNTTVNSTTNSTINNNVKLAATSGDAKVTGNTKAGNATSGDATASANIANIANSSLSFSSWFGVLFINVFGSWNGSFGIDTAAGNPSNTGAGVTQSTGSSPETVKVFSFVPKNSGRASSGPVPLNSLSSGGNISNTGSSSRDQVVLASATGGGGNSGRPGGLAAAPARHSNYLWTVGSLAALTGVLTVADAATNRKKTAERARLYLRSIIVPPFKKS